MARSRPPKPLGRAPAQDHAHRVTAVQARLAAFRELAGWALRESEAVADRGEAAGVSDRDGAILLGRAQALGDQARWLVAQMEEMAAEVELLEAESAALDEGPLS